MKIYFYIGGALLWAGLASLVFVPTLEANLEASLIAGGGFLAFMVGLSFLLHYLKK